MPKVNTAFPESRFLMQYDIEMNNCGFYKELPREIHVSRPNGRTDYQFIFVIRGKVQASLENSVFTASAGMMLYFPSNLPHAYYYEAEDDCLYYWVHFCGNRATEWAALFGLTAGVYPLHHITSYGETIEQMLRDLRSDRIGCDLLNNARMQEMLVEIGREIAQNQAGNIDPRRKKIQKIAATLRLEPERDIPNSLFAAECDLSEYYFIRLFKEEIGVPPHRYRMNALMEKAKGLLLDTDLYIEEIAALLGMEDPLYFSRYFKKHTGVSPKEYRNNHKKA